MEYELIVKSKEGKEVRTLNLKESKGDGTFMLARIQACAAIYKKVEVKEINNTTYEITCIGRK